MTTGPRRVLVAGATGYVGKFAVEAFKQRGYWVRALTRSEERVSPSRDRSPRRASDRTTSMRCSSAS